jgi:hypothetical protein
MGRFASRVTHRVRVCGVDARVSLSSRGPWSLKNSRANSLKSFGLTARTLDIFYLSEVVFQSLTKSHVLVL